MKKIFFLSLFILLNIFPTCIYAYDTQEISDIEMSSRDFKSVKLIILFKDNIIDKNIEDIIWSSGGKIKNKYPDIGGIEVVCNPDLIPKIKTSNNVQSISPSHIIKVSSNKEHNLKEESINESNVPDNYFFENFQWDIKRVTNNGESFKLESGNHNVVVGIVDSGIDKNHPDLRKNFLGGKNLVPSNFNDDTSEIGDSEDVNDRVGHGTSVAGVIAANGKIKGVAPNIGFKSYRIFNKDYETTASICTSAILQAVKDGVKVINLSLGGYDLKGKCYWLNTKNNKKYNLGSDMAEYSLYKRAIKYAINKGGVVVASAGNDSLDCANKRELTNHLNELNNNNFEYSGLTYEVPGTIKGVITVSATGKNDKKSYYSNYGEGYIDIAAPGGDETYSGNITDMCLTTTINSSYRFSEGSSVAAPKVSAAAALVLCKDRNLSPKSVAKKLYKNSNKLNNSAFYGHGLLNVYNVLNNT